MSSRIEIPVKRQWSDQANKGIDNLCPAKVCTPYRLWATGWSDLPPNAKNINVR